MCFRWRIHSCDEMWVRERILPSWGQSLDSDGSNRIGHPPPILLTIQKDSTFSNVMYLNRHKMVDTDHCCQPLGIQRHLSVINQVFRVFPPFFIRIFFFGNLVSIATETLDLMCLAFYSWLHCESVGLMDAIALGLSSIFRFLSFRTHSTNLTAHLWM
jgi:hypothetical protein